MNILIIEDEPLAAEDLITQLLALDRAIHVLGVIPSVQGAVEWLNANPAPDLIFSDIQLQDGTSFSIFNTVAVKVPVVFCTAYNQFALEAFQHQGFDYLMKPVSRQDLERCFEKLSLLQNTTKRQDAEQPARNAVILSYAGDQIIPVPVATVGCIHYQDGRVELKTRDRGYELRTTLDQVFAELDENLFFRANRQYILHRQAIAHMEQESGRKLVVHLHHLPDKVVVSKQRSRQFLNWLKAAG